MKKLIALILAAAVCLSLVPASLAETQMSEAEMTQLTEYDYDLALKYIADREWEGITRNVDGVNALFWLPSYMVKMELTQEAKDSGVLSCYYCDTFMVQVRMANYGGISLEDYLERVTGSGFDNARIAPVNGMDFVIYDEPVDGCAICRVAAAPVPGDLFLEFIYYALEEEIDAEIEGSIATIRFED